MSFQRKLIVVALASVLPLASAYAQSATDLQKEIAALKAQLQSLQQKVEALETAPTGPSVSQQVTRIEQKMDLKDDDAEKSGFKGIKINGVIEAYYKYDDLVQSHNFGASAGFADEFAMLQITKESQDGEGVDWTLRLLPGSTTYNHVHEASLSVPLDKENRIIGGLIPDWQGYEFYFANANATLGSQFLTHNALFDLAGATSYSGLGMSHNFGGSTYALKWLIGNIDPANDAIAGPAVGSVSKRTTGLAYRGDWFINEYAYIGLAGAHGSGNRDFNVMAIDGGYVRGDWAFNGHLNIGSQSHAAANGDEARWSGVSGLIGYKLTPRLQLLARADYLENRANGGGTYAYNGAADSVDVDGNPVYQDVATGLGPERDSTGAQDMSVGANVTRLTLGTNYQINANTQWKLEYRLDQATGYNFKDLDGNWKNKKNSFGTAVVVSF